MKIRILRRLSLVKGQRLEAGEETEIGEEIAIDLIQRGLAEPVRSEPERAVTTR